METHSTTMQEDAAPVLALVDLYGSQPADGSNSSSGGHPAAKQRIASLYFVHQGLYSERPSMRILQVRKGKGSAQQQWRAGSMIAWQCCACVALEYSRGLPCLRGSARLCGAQT